MKNNGFNVGKWLEEVNVRDFINNNYTPYEGDESFLCEATSRTKKLWNKCEELQIEEQKKGVMDIDTEHVAGIDAFAPGYIDKENEVIFGLQTDAPLKRMINPYGGMRMVKESLDIYNYELDKDIDNVFTNYRKTHNAGVFDAYTEDMRKARSNGLLTGLPDAYGRGRIIGDFRRIPLYGIDYLITKKEEDLKTREEIINKDTIQLREEIREQIKALSALKSMALKYDIDISKPASSAKEAVQFLYFGYLAGVKENNGAAMSLGRISTFLDIYIEKDLHEGKINESDAQELIDQFVIKLRLVRHLRTPEYDALFAGDPTWVTESIGGMSSDGRPLVTKTSFRFIHTLINLGSAPEPNITILWANKLPLNFKNYCAKMSIKTNALQYENDDLMRPICGDDYAIACCVSAMEIGKQMQYFGARCNLAKALLYSFNGGHDEISDVKVIEGLNKNKSEILEYDEVINNFHLVIEKLAKLYVDTMNIIHFMHDIYAYESVLMALHNTDVERLMAFGISGFSVVVDSLSAIKYAKVKTIRDESGKIIDYETTGDFPKFGNDDDRVDDIAKEIVKKFSKELKRHDLIRNAYHTLSILTITSNVVYGEKTGATPDGRKKGEPFAPGANPMHGRDTSGALASLNSVAKIPYCSTCEDGISNTFTMVPNTLGKDEDTRITNLVNILDGYFGKNAHHLNVNVLNKEELIDAMDNPDKHSTLTIRVSGYAVHFNRLSKRQQEEVINRTFHEVV